MTFDAALTYLCQGKKVRRSKWSEGYYIVLDANMGSIHQNVMVNNTTVSVGRLVDSERLFSLDDVISTDWETVD